MATTLGVLVNADWDFRTISDLTHDTINGMWVFVRDPSE
jgi:hypothetical protein